MGQIDVSKEILERLYYDEQLTQAEMAQRLGCSKSYISQSMRKYGVVARSRGGSRRMEIPREEIERLYAEGLTQAEIAAHFGCSKATIYQRMREYGLLARVSATHRKVLLSLDELEAFYEEGLTQAEIAQRIGCSIDTVYQRTREYGLMNHPMYATHRRQLNISREELESLFDKGLTQAQIAKELGCSTQTIRRRRREYGLAIEVQSTYQRIEISREELEQLYAQGLTLKEMANKFSCSKTTVLKRLREYELQPTISHHAALKPFSRDELYQLYIEQQLTTSQVADQLGCDKSTVLKYLKKYDIPRRIPGIQPKTWVPTEQLAAWPTAELAYMVGLIAANGCLRKGNRVINLATRHLEVIELYRSSLHLHEQVPTRVEEVAFGNKRYIVEFTDRGLRTFLEELGITPAKSSILGPLSIPDAVFADFVRGYCDGKGKWDIRWHKYLRTQLRSRSPAFLAWMREKIKELTGLEGQISGPILSYDGHKTRGIAIALGQWLYYAPDVPALSKKRAIWASFTSEQ